MSPIVNPLDLEIRHYIRCVLGRSPYTPLGDSIEDLSLFQDVCSDYLSSGRYREDPWAWAAVEAHCTGLLDFSSLDSSDAIDMTHEGVVLDWLVNKRERDYVIQGLSHGDNKDALHFIADRMGIPRYNREV